jgi:PhzF family phenazine biosynthesis protein
MKKFQFKKIDAFATTNSDGNPAGYIRLNSQLDISDSEMQQIAKELKGFVNEVGYITQTSGKCFSLRFFSSEREVDFCGHATIAIMYDLIKSEGSLQKLEVIEIETNRGKLSVENHILKEDAVFIMSPVPINKPMTLDMQDISNALKISKNEIATKEMVSIINAGLTTLIIPIKNLDAILQISPDLEELKDFCNRSEVDIIEVWTSEVSNTMNSYRTRVFAPKFGYLEDPATGSGNSAFGYYLIKNRKFEKETLTIEQNADRNRFNIIKIRKKIDSGNNLRILFGGGANTRIEGIYILQ